MPGEWKQIRRSVPARELYEVPDNAITYAAWQRGNHDVVVYEAEDLRTTPPKEEYYVASIKGNNVTVKGPYSSQRRAMQKAEKKKTEGFFGI